MPMLPIDLQTMFSHINQVGREQAQIKANLPHSQMIRAMELAEQTKMKDTVVDESQEIGEGVDKVNEDEQKSQQQKKQNYKEKQSEKDEKKTEKQVYQDPDLGQHIDITT